MKHKLTREDILPMAEYGRDRRAHRRHITEVKRSRRMEVGPFATFYFENYETMWHQVHEMLYIERGGEEQIAGELEAYNPLIPNGHELVATVMFEIENAERRARELARMGGVEETMRIRLGDSVIAGVPEEDVDRTSAAGKASSVQFLHFPFTPEQIALFRDPDTEVVLEIAHPTYSHMAVMPAEVRAAVSQDFD